MSFALSLCGAFRHLYGSVPYCRGVMASNAIVHEESPSKLEIPIPPAAVDAYNQHIPRGMMGRRDVVLLQRPAA